MLDLLTSLADKNLVVAETHADGTRFGMLETVRHYAQDRLRESGEDEPVRDNHVEYFLGMAGRLVDPLLNDGAIIGNEWLVIAPTDVGPQKWGAGGEMVMWASKDEGKTWTRRAALTSNSELNHSYARRPLNARDPFFVFWADGNPDKLSASRLYFADSSGRKVWRLPYTIPEGADSGVPELLK